jgi:hypothetical protein
MQLPRPPRSPVTTPSDRPATVVRPFVDRPTGHAGTRHTRVLFLVPGPSPQRFRAVAA